MSEGMDPEKDAQTQPASADMLLVPRAEREYLWLHLLNNERVSVPGNLTGLHESLRRIVVASIKAENKSARDA